MALNQHRKVLNIGDNTKIIEISPHFHDFDHVLADIDPAVAPIC